MSDSIGLPALTAFVEGTARAPGEGFFAALTRNLAQMLEVRDANVTELVEPRKVRTLARWSAGQLIGSEERDVAGTPCEAVVAGEFRHYPSGVARQYPKCGTGVDSYIGMPLKSEAGAVLGHLCAWDGAPMSLAPAQLLLFEAFAASAAAELRRLLTERNTRATEERLRDLFDEAPIAYVHEDLDSRFIRANRTALRILGVRPDEVKGFRGLSLVPDTPEAKRRAREAFASIGAGTDTSGVVLELSRKDNGKPVFIQWWSRPDPSGQYTRTMFVDITERVLMEREQARLQAENVYLQEEIKSVHNFEEIIGASAGLLQVLENVRLVAPTDASVLICGETGTGKELIARAIHSASRRAGKPFIKLNCAALPAGLVESELFGHERGAFSGAIQKRIGRFELANNGTIFLDEIGEMPLDVQTKLLRVLQEYEFERVGSSHTTKVDVRVIAATNRDLARAVGDGSFRQDLYYRLSVFPVTLPPLRERLEDIPLLVRFFAQKYGPRVGRRVESIDAATMQRLIEYPWPGNIRELENLIERALILASSSVLHVGPEILGPGAPLIRPPSTGLAAPQPQVPETAAALPAADAPQKELTSLAAVQREHILRVLQAVGWVIEGERGAAARLGVKPATLRFRMKKFGISRSVERP
ncbi:MAG TPA: sigma 54-interacting transcriptional regulator [Steroidobacteraceae bacterium]|nr:sigma 54-interacting transcriptional regulator [Steroidobacteraceae bacterium]